MVARVALLFLTALCLVAPGSAAARSFTLGSPLTATPTDVGCETRFYFSGSSSGDYVPGPSNSPDCTFRQQGIFNQPNDPRTGYVPGDGRITRVAVRSGPNPGLIRFVIGRQLTQSGQGAGTACCYFVRETAAVRPRPNAITSFDVNLPVERNTNTKTDIITADWIGVSGVSGTGSLPIHSTGQHNAFQYTQTGAPNVGVYYPRLGAVPNDSNGSGRYEEGQTGFEVLLRWTWCPAGESCAGGGPGPGAGGGGATGGPDTLTGTPGRDRICGLLGADTLRGLAGADTLFGDLCNQRAKRAAAAATGGNDRLFGGPGRDKLYGAGGKDLLKGGGANDRLVGGRGNDRLYGNAGRNTYSGGPGKDRLYARNGKRETVNCGAGRDTASVDKRDRVRGCEKVKRARK